MIRLIPGDAVAIMLGANTEITDEAMNELRSRLGLDKSILEQTKNPADAGSFFSERETRFELATLTLAT